MTGLQVAFDVTRFCFCYSGKLKLVNVFGVKAVWFHAQLVTATKKEGDYLKAIYLEF